MLLFVSGEAEPFPLFFLLFHTVPAFSRPTPGFMSIIGFSVGISNIDSNSPFEQIRLISFQNTGKKVISKFSENSLKMNRKVLRNDGKITLKLPENFQRKWSKLPPKYPKGGAQSKRNLSLVDSHLKVNQGLQSPEVTNLKSLFRPGLRSSPVLIKSLGNCLRKLQHYLMPSH